MKTLKEYLYPQRQRTFKNAKETFVMNIDDGEYKVFDTYEELCDEWLNVGLIECDQRDVNDKEQQERDREEYYDTLSGKWFVPYIYG